MGSVNRISQCTPDPATRGGTEAHGRTERADRWQQRRPATDLTAEQALEVEDGAETRRTTAWGEWPGCERHLEVFGPRGGGELGNGCSQGASSRGERVAGSGSAQQAK